jgi:tripartite-type tricarboxylate transporter receptor subunit TctC
MGAPDMPADRAAALRAAARHMMDDPAYIADMKKAELDVEPMGGEDLAALVGKAMSTPDKIVELLKQQTAPID